MPRHGQAQGERSEHKQSWRLEAPRPGGERQRPPGPRAESGHNRSPRPRADNEGRAAAGGVVAAPPKGFTAAPRQALPPAALDGRRKMAGGFPPGCEGVGGWVGAWRDGRKTDNYQLLVVMKVIFSLLASSQQIVGNLTAVLLYRISPLSMTQILHNKASKATPLTGARNEGGIMAGRVQR